MTPAALQQYRNIQVTTASQGTLIVMLYDGLLRYVSQAERAIARNEIEPAHNALIRAHAILHELASTLNPAAGEIADHLLRLYDFMVEQIVRANVEKSAEPLRPVAVIAAQLRSAWAEAAKAAGNTPAPAAKAR